MNCMSEQGGLAIYVSEQGILLNRGLWQRHGGQAQVLGKDTGWGPNTGFGQRHGGAQTQVLG